MTIGICEDEDIFLDDLTNKILNYLNHWNLKADLTAFHNGEEFLNGNEPIDVLFLDIELGGMSGIEIKNLLSAKRMDTIIVFTSSHPEYTREMIGVNVHHFLEKPVKETELFKVLDDIMDIFRETTILIRDGGVSYQLNYKKIKYIMAEDQYTRVYTDPKTYLFRKKLKDWEKLLPEDHFCKINRSVIVSFSFFVREGSGIRLDNGKLVTFGRQQKNEIENRYRKYLERLI